MAKEDFSLKKDVLQLQKKVADLELSTTELNESLSKIDSATLDDIKQRLGDVEDLTMVENAGIIELKKMLEGVQTPAQSTQLPEELTSRLSALEEKISAAPQLDTTQIEEIKNGLENLKTEVETSLSDIRTSVPNMDVVTNEVRREINRSVDWLKNEVNSELEERAATIEKQVSGIQDSLSKLPSADELNSVVDGLSSSFKSFRSSIETRFLTEQNKLEGRWSELEAKFSLFTGLLKTIEEFKSDNETKKTTLESMLSSLEDKLKMPLHERAVRELEKIRNDWIANNARLDAIETMVRTFTRQIEEVKPAIKKLETFDKLLDLHKEITQKLDEMKQYHEAGKKIAEMAEMMDSGKIEKSIEKNLKRELEKLKGDLREQIRTLENDMSVFQGSLMSLEQNRSNLTALDKNLRFNENIVDTLQKELVEVRHDLMNIKKQPMKEVKEIPELVKKIDSLEADIQGIKSLEPEDKTSGLVNKISELESRIDSINASVGFDEQMSEIVSRLVFLESRLVAMEGMVQDLPRYSPIIVE